MKTRAFVAGVVVAASSVASANVLMNGSFEDPAITPGTFVGYTTGQSIGAGWVVDSTDLAAAVITNGYSGGGAAWHTTPAGNQYLYVGDSLMDTVVSQQVVLGGGVACTLDFLQAAFISPASQGRVYIDVLQGGVSVLPGGEAMFSVAPGSDFEAKSLAFTSTVDGPYTLTVRAADGFVACVDDFVLIPSPAGVSLAGLAGLVLGRRKR